ncbi:MAG: GNAT family N-acetyltransferase [Phycisphaerae bacterium]|mgnify:FL=1|nr:GNAT family N-acetyltransferase [Phycisphaerae bacterium]
MIRVERFNQTHLSQLQALINAHLQTVVPGWSLPEEYIASRIESNPFEHICDPWVVERETLCALKRERVCAAGHLLRYGDDPEVGEGCRNVAEMNWFLAWPQDADAGHALLQAACERMDRWKPSQQWGGVTLPVPCCAGIADAWPHIATMLETVGFMHEGHIESVYAGRLDGVVGPGDSPVGGVSLRREACDRGVSFTAYEGDRRVGHCQCAADLTLGGRLLALRNWAELADMLVTSEYRSRGIGSWLVRHAAQWLRLAGCDRIVIAVAADDEAAGAGRFYQRFGWHSITRLRRGWQRTVVA